MNLPKLHEEFVETLASLGRMPPDADLDRVDGLLIEILHRLLPAQLPDDKMGGQPPIAVDPDLLSRLSRSIDAVIRLSEHLIDWQSTTHIREFRCCLRRSLEIENDDGFLGRFLDSLNELAEWVMADLNVGPEFLVISRDEFVSGPGRIWAKLETIVPDPDSGHEERVCWDIIDMPVSDRALACLQMCLLPRSIVIETVAKAPAPFQLGPMFEFHPQRFEYSRGRGIRRLAQQFGGEPVTSDDLNQIVEGLVDRTNQRISSVPRRVDQDTGLLNMTTELALFDGYRRFLNLGQAIFDLTPELVAMFRKTSIDELPIDLIRLPYQAQYLHFGRVEAWRNSEGWYLTGAYVYEEPIFDVLAVLFTWEPETAGDVMHWPIYPEPYNFLSFNGHTRRLMANEALEEVFAEDLAILREQAGPGHREMLASRDDLADDLAGYGIDFKSMRVATRPRAEFEQRRIEDSRPIVLAAMPVVANALMYLTMYPDDRDTIWPESAPIRLTLQADPSKPRKEQERAKTRLQQLGYQPVQLCGRQMRLSSRGRASTMGPQKGMARHWRRGHWRWQRYGQGRAQSRLRWIMPTLVGGHDSGDDEPPYGHVYSVD